MDLIVKKTIGGFAVKGLNGNVLASFGNDEQSQRLYAVLLNGIATSGSTLYDEDNGFYVIGTMDQLLNEGG